MANASLTQQTKIINSALFRAANKIGSEVSCEVYDSVIYELKEKGLVTDDEHTSLGRGEMIFLTDLVQQEVAAAVFQSIGVILDEIVRERIDKAGRCEGDGECAAPLTHTASLSACIS